MAKITFITGKQAAAEMDIPFSKWRKLTQLPNFPIYSVGRNSVRMIEAHYAKWLMSNRKEITQFFTDLAKQNAEKQKAKSGK